VTGWGYLLEKPTGLAMLASPVSFLHGNRGYLVAWGPGAHRMPKIGAAESRLIVGEEDVLPDLPMAV